MWELPDWAGYCRFRERFEQVMDPRFHSIEWLDQMVLGNRVKLWIGEAAATVAEVKIFPTGARELHFLVGAGELEEIVSSLRPRAEDYARLIGCPTVSISSRGGWERVLKAHGYERHQIELRKELQ